MRNFRFFILTDASLHFREVRFFRAKLVGSSLAIGAVTVAAILLLNYLSGDILGLGYDRMSLVTAENQILKDQVRDLSQKMNGIQHALDYLSERGNELRLLADLSTIDEDTRAASTGGTHQPTLNAFLAGEAGEVLSRSEQMIEKLSREVKLQETSYRDIAKRLEYNKGLFAHMPAIKPMIGGYSINGFGMRIHPVLRVYRMHEGIDIINDVGSDVYATGDGIVHFAGRTQGGYGIVIDINHGFGYSSLYAHLSKVLVHEGQTVRRGELIAKSGRTGLVSGPHLHYEVRRGGVRQNPVDYFFDDVDAAKYRMQLASVQ